MFAPGECKGSDMQAAQAAQQQPIMLVCLTCSQILISLTHWQLQLFTRPQWQVGFWR